MRIDVMEAMPVDLLEAAWRLYLEAFEELRSTAVQRHIMARADFDDMMEDVRIDKYLCSDAGRHVPLCALATLTTKLEAMPLISPDYFQRRWPRQFAEGRVFYIGFVAVHPDFRGAGAFEVVVTALYRAVAAGRGVAVLDVCRRNEQLFDLPQAIHRVLESLADDVRSDRIDHQSYWSYEFPSHG
ncbi:MAG TPA: hypothetical protein VFR67_10170 [Pilimelia sp.]|nr:hypothetical protein [Pilimelia sp.]